MTLSEIFAPVLHGGFLDQSSGDGTLSHKSNLSPISHREALEQNLRQAHDFSHLIISPTGAL